MTRWEEARRRGWPVAATACAALGLLTDQVGIALPLFVAARAPPASAGAGRRPSSLGGIVPALLAAGVAAAVHPQAATADWGHTLLRLGGGDGAPPARRAQEARPALVARWLLNYFHLLRAEWWWPAAVAGLFCVRPLVARRRLLTLAGLLVLPIFALREPRPLLPHRHPPARPRRLGPGRPARRRDARRLRDPGPPPAARRGHWRPWWCCSPWGWRSDAPPARW